MTPELFRQLAALGLSTEQMAGVLEIMEADAEVRKAKGRERVQRWRDRKAGNVTKRHVTSENVSKRLTRADDTPATEENKQTNKEVKKENKSPRDELAVVLDAEHADAVLDHRQKLRKPLTAYAARQLAASFASCPDANAAADLMIESGWLKIKPDWIESRSRQNGHSPPRGKRMNAVEAYLSLHTERENEQGSRTIDNRDVELLPPDKPGLPSSVADLVQAFRWPVGQRDH